MKKSLSQFLECYCPDKFPLLLGLSGGPDSMALFHLLLEIDYPFEVAHVDHRWRKESEKESAFLVQLCQQAGVAIHLKQLSPPQEKNNLEERGREMRLSFFKGVLAAQNLKGVLLAHHADDHAETVLKRIFEGASLPKLRGLLPKVEIEGITLYRPLLKQRKTEILKWLNKKQIPYFLDPTNDDPRFLRSRLRKKLIPSLSADFGKEIASNLCRLGEAAAELEEFLKESVAPYASRMQFSTHHALLDLSGDLPLSNFLLKGVLRDFFGRQGLTLPYPILEAIFFHLQKRSHPKSFQIGEEKIVVHQQRVRVMGKDAIK
jgi:tRNA(Ile)-lysidine synthase